LFTDIEGSTKLWEQHPEAMRLALARHDALLRAAIEASHGAVFKTVGDAFCAAFTTAPDALAATVEAQRALSAFRWGGLTAENAESAEKGREEERDPNEPPVSGEPPPFPPSGSISAPSAFSAVNSPEGMQPLRVRMALHTGIAEERDNDYFG